MTRDADFKKLVRARMAATGQTYTAARDELLAATPSGPTPPVEAPIPVPQARATAFERARAEQATVVGRFLVDGRLARFPMRRKARAAVLLHLVALFEPGRDYTEREVNEMLAEVHEDFAFWRRELVDYGYLTRSEGVYRLPDSAPERPAHMRQEIPDWEALWLPGHLSGSDTTLR